MKGRVQILGGRIDGGSVLKEQHHDIGVAQAGSNVERSLLFLSINRGGKKKKLKLNMYT